MKALVITCRGKLELQEIPEPQPGPYDALVRIEACGICNSTDSKLITGQMFWAPPFPFVLGHESVGTVVEVGSQVRKFTPGDRVTRPVAFWAGSRPDLNVACGGFAEYGIVRDAAAMAADGDRSLLSDYTTQRQCVVPEGLTPVQAALAISLSETASVLRHLPKVRGQEVVVAGTGVVGLAFGLWLKLAGAYVITLGRRPQRLERVRKLGADAAVDTSCARCWDTIRRHAGGEVDGLIEATGDAGLANQLLSVLRPEGFACAYGVPPTGVKYAPRWSEAIVEEHVALPWVADLILRGWVRSDDFVTHTWRLDQAIEAFAAVERGDVLKGFITL